MKVLNVPYKSQWDGDAQGTRNDCGPASCAMILAYLGTKVTTDQVFEKTGAGTGYINFTQLTNAVSSFGHKMSGAAGKKLSDIKSNIDKNIPCIVVLHYGHLSGRQDSFTGPHILVVVGYDDKGVYVNDPNYWGSRREEGDHKFHTFETFDKAWQSTEDGNKSGNLWVIEGTPAVPPVDCEEKLAEKDEIIEGLRDSRNAWRDTSKKQAAQITQSNTEVENRKEQVGRLEGLVEQKQNTINELLKQTELTKPLQEEIQLLQKQVDSFAKEKGQLQLQVRQLETEIERLKTQANPSFKDVVDAFFAWLKGRNGNIDSTIG